MADIAARLIAQGVAHQVKNDTTKATETKQSEPCGRVVVLTDGGGFIEVYVAPERTPDMPRPQERVLWTLDVTAYTRTSPNGYKYAFLDARLVEAHDVAAALPAAA